MSEDIDATRQEAIYVTVRELPLSPDSRCSALPRRPGQHCVQFAQRILRAGSAIHARPILARVRADPSTPSGWHR